MLKHIISRRYPSVSRNNLTAQNRLSYCSALTYRIMKSYFLTTSLFIAQLSLSAPQSDPFLAAGFPASDREWTGSDYGAVVQAIQTGRAPLPRLSDENARRYLERLTATKNLSLHRNKNVPLNQRMGDFLQIMDKVGTVLKTYLVQANAGQDLHAEMSRIMAFQLYVAALGVDLMNEFLPTVPKDDKYEVRMRGVKQMYSGLTSVFAGATTSLTETSFYSTNDISGLLRAMQDSLPTLMQAFSPDYMLELQRKLTEQKSHFTGQDLKYIDKMLKELRTDTEQSGGGRR